jgi:hypothetical protein
MGVLVSVGPLSNAAKDFIAARPIELIDKNKLATILDKIMNQ